jgi:hypothetical protein
VRTATDLLVLGAERPNEQGWAVRYLLSSRGPAGGAGIPVSPAERARIIEAQAELAVGVILEVLDGLGLTDEVWYRGSEIAQRELEAALETGWSPL